MVSEDQCRRSLPNCSLIGGASPHPSVEVDRDVPVERAEGEVTIHNGTEGGTLVNNGPSGSAQHYNHDESEQNNQHVSREFINPNQALPIENPAESDDDRENVPNKIRRSKRHLEAANPSGRHNRPLEESSSSSRASSSEVQTESRKKPRSMRLASAIREEHAMEGQPGPASLAASKSQQQSKLTKKQSSNERRGTTRMPLRKKASTSSEGAGVPSAEEELDLRQLLGSINPMGEEVWQWAIPAIKYFDAGRELYERCFTGTQEDPTLSLKLGDAVELMGPKNVKFLGIVVEMFQRYRIEPYRCRMRYLDQRAQVVWLYHKNDLPKDSICEVSATLKKKGLNPETALFISQHSDEHPLQKIQHSIRLVSVDEYLSNAGGHDSEEYYLAGVYDSFRIKVSLRLRGGFSLPEMFCYGSLRQQALLGNEVLMPETPPADWLMY